MQILQPIRTTISGRQAKRGATRPRTLAVHTLVAMALAWPLLVSASDAQHAHKPAHAAAVTADAMAALPASKALEISDCWVRLLPAAVPSGAYFTLHNASPEDITVDAAASPAYGSVMLHQTVQDGAVSRMAMSGAITIRGNGRFAFKPGGHHAMLEQPARKLVVGETITLYLRTTAHEQAKATCTLESAAARH